MSTIKVLGPGCTNCQRLTSLTEQALAELGRPEQVAGRAEPLRAAVVRQPALALKRLDAAQRASTEVAVQGAAIQSAALQHLLDLPDRFPLRAEGITWHGYPLIDGSMRKRR